MLCLGMDVMDAEHTLLVLCKVYSILFKLFHVNGHTLGYTQRFDWLRLHLDRQTNYLRNPRRCEEFSIIAHPQKHAIYVNSNPFQQNRKFRVLKQFL